MRLWWAAASVAAAVACGGASQSKVRQVGGMLDIQPPTVNFGDVTLGKDQTLPVKLLNTGIAPITVTELTHFDDPAFLVTGLPVTIGSGRAAEVQVRYRPPSLGANQRILQLASDSPEAPRNEVALRGRAVRGLVQVSADLFDFGNVVVNEKAQQMLSFDNNDGHALTSIVIAQPDGADPGAFRLDRQGDLELQPDQQLAVAIAFTPDRAGDFTARLMVTQCPTCSPRPLTLTGRGVTSLLAVHPDAIDFGEVALTAAAQQPFTVTNISKAPLLLQSLSLSGSPDLSAQMSGVPLPVTMAPGETLSGVARFRPMHINVVRSQAILAANDGGPAVLSLQGTGIGPLIQVTPRALFVGATAVGTTREGRITITNVGFDPRRVAPLQLTATRLERNDGQFRIASVPAAVGEPGQSGELRVAFTPSDAGFSQALLVIESNDPLHPHIEVPLTALGRFLPPCTLTVTPGPPLDFGAVKLFLPSVQGFELTNAIEDDCIVGDPEIIAGAPAFRWPGGVAPSGRTLPPGGRMSVRIAFDPEQATTFSGAVRFYVSNRNAPSMTIDLLGQGDDSCFFVSPGAVDFGRTTLGCGIPSQNLFAVNHCDHFVHVSSVTTSGPPFSTSVRAPFDVAPQTSAPIPLSYQPASAGDDVGAVWLLSSLGPQRMQAGITGGAQIAATILDQWDQAPAKVDLLLVIDNSGSMKQEQQALAANIDHLWNAISTADYHIAVTTMGLTPVINPPPGNACFGGAFGGEAGRFFPVDNSRPRILTPQTPNARDALLANTNVGTCQFDARFLDPVVAALTDPLVSSTKAPGTPWPADGNAGFLRDDARLALLAVSDADDDEDMTAPPPPVGDALQQIIAAKHGARDLISFAAIVPLSLCPLADSLTPRYQEIARELNGKLFDLCDLGKMGAVLDAAMGDLLLPLTSFQLSGQPGNPAAIVVTVDGAVVTRWSYDAGSNRIVFPRDAAPPPGSHITAKYDAACR